MNRLQVSLSLSLLSLVSLTGCAGFGAASFPDATVNPSQTPVGAIQGSVYGGHAPLVGAHVYLLEPGTGGYGSLATSLLCNGGTNTNCTTQLTANTSDPGVSTGWYYTTTDSTGAFSLNGDYACTVGSPVYLYAYAGSPVYPSVSTGSNVFSIKSFTVQAATKTGGNNVYTVSFNIDQTTTNRTENFYAGEQVVISGMPAPYTYFNSTGYVASNATLTTTGFELATSIANGEANPAVPATYNSGSNGTALSGTVVLTADGTATATPTPGTAIGNTGVVNLATLGVCPSTGSLAAGGTIFNGSTSNPIKYIYLNEVSTIATAYAFEGFTPTAVTATNKYVTYIGSSSTNLLGIENAALNAALLYDINGSQITTAYAGEGHIANPKTPSGNGLVPQNLLNTLGNILAACVDSNNNSANTSPQCTTLFTTATSTGGTVASGGIAPVDTAEAAINIANHPAGTSAGATTFVTALYTLPTGNVPFTPNLVSAGATQPTDFTVAIQYPSGTFAAQPLISSATTLTTTVQALGPESIAIDGFGNPWFNDLTANTGGSYYIWEMTPQGEVAYSQTSTYPVGYLTIDPSNNIWTGTNQINTQGEIEIVAPAFTGTNIVNTATATRTTNAYKPIFGGTGFTTAGFYDGYMSVANGSGNIYIGAAPVTVTQGTGTSQTSTATWYTLEMTSLGATGHNAVADGLAAGSQIAHGAVENQTTGGSGDIWWTNEVADNHTGNTTGITRVDPTTLAPVTGFPVNSGTNTNINAPEMPAIDQAGNLWAANQGSNTVVKVTPTAGVTINTALTLTTPFGLTIDGLNNAFVGNRGSTTIGEIATGTGALVSPATGYTLSGLLSKPLNIAMDPSGNIWVAAYEGNMVVQWIGAGTPIYTPLSKASLNNKVSVAP